MSKIIISQPVNSLTKESLKELLTVCSTSSLKKALKLKCQEELQIELIFDYDSLTEKKSYLIASAANMDDIKNELNTR